MMAKILICHWRQIEYDDGDSLYDYGRDVLKNIER